MEYEKLSEKPTRGGREVPLLLDASTLANRGLFEGTSYYLPTLTFLSGNALGKEMPLTMQQLTLGRGEEADIMIADPSVSRRHIQLTCRRLLGKDGSQSIKVVLRDLGSKNGTLVNYRRVRQTVLRPGDKIYLTEPIGSGGMSQVYLALNPRTRESAIKIMVKRATASSISYARFLREVEIIRKLHHPNIIQVLDSGSREDCFYYMMEFMPGGNLARRMSCQRFSLEEKISLFAMIADAMAHAHEKGVIHRDLKPTNVLVNECGSLVVSDFGIAKVTDGSQIPLTRSSEIMGTIAYLAPEQSFSTKRVDQRADVYSLGAILYEMLMGFPPLGKFPWPRDTQPHFPAALQIILENCLALNPDDRYEHAGLLLFS